MTIQEPLIENLQKTLEQAASEPGTRLQREILPSMSAPFVHSIAFQDSYIAPADAYHAFVHRDITSLSDSQCCAEISITNRG